MHVIDAKKHEEQQCGIDICFPCDLAWFDGDEEYEISVASMRNIMQRIREDKMSLAPLSSELHCPRCNTLLRKWYDYTVDGAHFYSFRCKEHGNLYPFLSLLKSKNYIRPLNLAEKNRLQEMIGNITCSKCGGGVDIKKDDHCPYCGARITFMISQISIPQEVFCEAKEKDDEVSQNDRFDWGIPNVSEPWIL